LHLHFVIEASFSQPLPAHQLPHRLLRVCDVSTYSLTASSKQHQINIALLHLLLLLLFQLALLFRGVY